MRDPIKTISWQTLGETECRKTKISGFLAYFAILGEDVGFAVFALEVPTEGETTSPDRLQHLLQGYNCS